MNWGHKIALSFILFAAFILFLVVRAFQEDFDLVAEDYYAQEIAYEEKLEGKSNVERLTEKVTVVQNGSSIIVSFPKGGEVDGEIYFYHPSRKIFDKTFALDLDDQNVQIINRNELVAGRYRVNVAWNAAGKEYYQQERIFIQ